MAGKSGIARQIERVRPKFVQELDINKLLPRLLRRGIFSVSEEKQILGPTVPQRRIEVLLDILSRKDRNVFVEFCRSLEECAPHLLTVIVLDAQQGQEEENPPTQALQIGFEIALKERDAVLRDNAKAQEERDELLRQLEQIRSERDQALLSLDNLAGRQGKLNKNLDPVSSSPTRVDSKKMKDKTGFLDTDQAYEETGPSVVWETHNVRLHKAPTFGFGIAVSGGRDSPHFANGDPSVAISDVLKAGPAEGRLQINDRIVSVNGISLENVDHNTAINVLRDCGNIVNLVVRRRVLLPAAQVERSSPPFKITLSKKNKKDEFGIVLGCKLFIKEIAQQSLASQESALKEGDTVLKINNTPVENMSLAEAKKLIEKSKDKLQLIVNKERGHSGSVSVPSAVVVNGVVQDKDNVNVYRPSTHPDDDVYVKDSPSAVQHVVPAGAYPNSENTRYDGHYVIDNDLPALATLPRSFENNVSQHRGDIKPVPPDHRDIRDGYYSDRDVGWQSQEFPPVQRPMDYAEDDVFPNKIIHDLDPRSVSFPKDKQTGLGLRLAGGNATGIFIASVQPGSAGEREGLVEGDQIILANEKEITGLTREEAVSYLTGLEGQVTLVVQYRKEEYDHIMASHEAGDSFYIRTHFNYTATDISEHSFKVGDIFHVKDTLFRGIGGSWLALNMSEDLAEQKKGTIPNSKTAEIMKTQQREESNKESFPNRGRGSLFKRKSSAARRVKSLGKDHWDEVIFAGLSTRFPAYERVVHRDPGFVRPVVIFGAVADIARERLLAEYPDRFVFPQVEKSTDQGEKREKSAIIRLGAIRDAITHRKHCLLDVTPQNVDRLNYAQYNPIVIFLKAETKQAVKDIRSRWKTTARSARKLLEQSEKVEKEYSHLFTGQLKHMGTDAWFPKLCEMIDSQQRQKIWMSEKQPAEDMSDDFMFPMSSRLSYAAGADSDLDIPRPHDDLDLSPMRKQRLMRSSSDPSVNTQDNILGIPPYPLPPTYKNQRIPSHDSRYSGSDVSPRSPLRDDYQMHPEDRYYPSYYSDHMTSSYQASRAHIDPYATLTPSERLRPHNQPGNFQGGYDEFGPYRERIGDNPLGNLEKQKTHPASNNPQMQGFHGQGGEHRGYTDNSSHSSDSYSKYVNSPQNKHDDTKLREKFGKLQATGREKSPGNDPYRFTRSTAQPVIGNVDRAKISDLSARYRKQDIQSKPSLTRQAPPPPNQQPITKKEHPPPVPVKTYSLKQRGMEPDELKMRNYENSNRAYNYTDINATSSRYGAPAGNVTPPLPPPPAASSYPSGLDTDRPYEYMSLRHDQSNINFDAGSNNRADFSPQQQQQQSSPPFPRQNIHPSSGYNNTAQASSQPYQQLYHQKKNQQQFQQGGRGHSLDSNLPPASLYPSQVSDHTYQDSKAFSNEVYMDHRDLQRARQAKVQPGGGYISQPDQGVRGKGREELQGGIPTLERAYARPRTDDEQLQEIQQSRYRAKSETRLAEMSVAQHHWNNTRSSISLHNDSNNNAPNLRSTPGTGSSTVLMPGTSSQSSRGRNNAGRYKSWDSSRHEHDMFSSYTKLITTPGFISQKKQVSGSSGELRADAGLALSHANVPANSIVTPGSAFSSYKKPVKQASFSGTTSTNSFQLSSNYKERRSNVKQTAQVGRSHSVGSALREPLVITFKKVHTSLQATDFDSAVDTSLPPPPNECVESVTDHPQKRNILKPGRRSMSPSIHFPPPPDFPPPLLSFLPLPPPPQLTAKNSQITSFKKTLAPAPPISTTSPQSLPPVTPVKTTLVPPVTKTQNNQNPIDVNGTDQELSEMEMDSSQGTAPCAAVLSRRPKKEESDSLEEKHTIVATAKGMFTSKGGLLESPETGVSILIPEGAIESNKEQEIYFKVCRDNSLLPPLDTEKGETLLSPLVMCGPHGTKFLKPVELRLPHCASANPESWSFALKSSESPSDQTTEWQNMTLAGSEGIAKGRVNQTSVSILVDHF